MIRDAAATFRKVSMKLDGTAPVTIHDRADLKATPALAVPTEFANAGRACVAGDRPHVHDGPQGARVGGGATARADGNRRAPGMATGRPINRACRMVSVPKDGPVGRNSFATAASKVPCGGSHVLGLTREGGAEGLGHDLPFNSGQMVCA